jgi:spoIIIJ-associated protein
MSEYKEFRAKNLDAAMAEACAYYDVPREKLEIEIVEDAKSGIFGLVGARKALIRARRAQFPGMDARPAAEQAAENVPENGAAPRTGRKQGKTPGERRTGQDENAKSHSADAAPARKAAVPDDDDGETPPPEPAKKQAGLKKGNAEREERALRPSPAPSAPPLSGADAEDGPEAEGQDSPLPHIPLQDLDQEKLRAVCETVLLGLARPVAGETPLEINITEERVQARIQCEDTGLLIGREGQNLAALQYLAARMITRAMGAPVRLHVDVGDYHSRQDSRLKELALDLAERVRATGRPQSTRPLSAYQRRVIHLTLQDDQDVQTRSSGEGAFKRVLVLRRKDA